MFKKLYSVIASVLALNFLLAAGGIGFLVYSGKLDKVKMKEIRTMVLATQPAATQPAATQPAQEAPIDTPISRLQTMLENTAGRRATAGSEIVQATFDGQSAVLERKLREVEDQRQQIEQARQDLQKQRDKVLADQKKLDQEQAAATQAASDEGFQQTLALYQAMPPKQAKAIFTTLDDEIVVRYLQAMDPRQASSILKEFKTPVETTRAQAILERMRRAQAKAD